jgi:hypothetical protein
MNDMNAINPTPWFADPGARQQLGINDAQFNRLNQAYQRALQRYNQNVAGLTPNASAGVNAQLSDAEAAREGLVIQRGQDGNVQTRTLVPRDQLQEQQQRSTTARQQQQLSDAQQQQQAAAQQQRQPTAQQQQQAAAQQQRQAGGSMSFEDFQNQFNTDFNNSVNSTLTDPTMRNRFNQLNTQFRGLSAFSDPTIQRQMNLNAQQQRELRQLAGTFRRDLMQLRRDARNNPDVVQQQFTDLQQQYAARLNAILNAQQQQIWQQLTGQQFQFPFTAFVPDNTGLQPNPIAPPRTAVPQTGAVQEPQNSIR